ncbi:MAG: hypothetical protein Q4C00_04735 [Bacillota bacterium]|nr:hypothetical protein [Bacillota bacterium]
MKTGNGRFQAGIIEYAAEPLFTADMIVLAATLEYDENGSKTDRRYMLPTLTA